MTDLMTPAEDVTPGQPGAPVTYAGRTRPGRGEIARIGLIVGCLVVLVASATVASGASPAATPDTGGSAPATPAAPNQTGPSAGRTGGLMGAGGMLGRMFGQGGHAGTGFGGAIIGGRGAMGGGAGIGRSITIAKIAGSDVSLKTDDGWARTITVTDKTEIRLGSQKASLSDLKVGDTVSLRETKNTDGSYTVTLVVVRVPTVAGTVTAVTSGGFTIKVRDGSTKSVTVSSSTDYLIAGSTGAKSDLSVGTRVQVEGTAGTGDAFTANVVHIVPDVRTGTVTATTSTSITVKVRDGSTSTIHVDSKTTFRVAGATTATVADVKVGQVLMAQGTSRADGSLDAVSVFSGQFKMPGAAHPNGAQPSAPAS